MVTQPKLVKILILSLALIRRRCRLIKGFKKVFQDIENENMSESIRLFQQTFGLSAG